MWYARRDLDSSKATQTAAVPTRTERAEASYTVPEPAPATSVAALPELMYPDYSSDGYSSDDSSEIITPPSSGPSSYVSSSRTYTGRIGTTPSRKNRTSPYPYPRPSRRTSSQNYNSPAYQRMSDFEAKVRYYAADRGTVIRESGSPCYVPYSPSQSWDRRDRYDRAPTPPSLSSATWDSYLLGGRHASQSKSTSAKHAYASASSRRGEEHPWRRYQCWQSTMPGVSANDKWGTFGLFRQ